MRIKTALMAAIICGIALSGCAMFQTLDGSSEEERRAFLLKSYGMEPERKQAAANEEPPAELAGMTPAERKLEEARRRLEETKKKLEEQEKEQQRQREEEEAKQAEAARQAELSQQQQPSQSEQAPVSIAATAPTAIASAGATEMQTEPAPEAKPAELKVKALSGDGNIASAKALAKKLKALGYNVTHIDKAPRKNFRRVTVYYREGLETEAIKIAGKLGPDVMIKPLTWQSVFDIIAVSGRK